jgi:glutathione S-transferase
MESCEQLKIYIHQYNHLSRLSFNNIIQVLMMTNITNTTVSSTYPKTNLWIWPTGLFPRRLIYYFRAKNITLSTLSLHNIHLIPVTLSSTGLNSKPGYKERPESTSLPCLAIEQPGSELFFIYESTAILEYFEERFGARDGYTDLRGSTIEQRTRTRDIISLLGDVIILHAQNLIHSDPSSLSWSGLKREDWSAAAAADAARRKHDLLSKLEDWALTDIIKGETPSISGKGAEATLADFVLMAMIQYHEDYFGGKDAIAGHGVLRLWCERAKQQPWFIHFAGLKRLEDGGFDEMNEHVTCKDGGDWGN